MYTYKQEGLSDFRFFLLMGVLVVSLFSQIRIDKNLVDIIFYIIAGAFLSFFIMAVIFALFVEDDMSNANVGLFIVSILTQLNIVFLGAVFFSSDKVGVFSIVSSCVLVVISGLICFFPEKKLKDNVNFAFSKSLNKKLQNSKIPKVYAKKGRFNEVDFGYVSEEDSWRIENVLNAEASLIPDSDNYSEALDSVIKKGCQILREIEESNKLKKKDERSYNNEANKEIVALLEES